MTVDSDDLPDELLGTGQWLCWDEQTRDGDPTKVPIDPETGSFASATDPDTWSDVETAIDAAEDYSGLGFVFTDDGPFVGADLDKCRDPETGSPEEWARDVIIDLDSYTEVSPSGTGFHIIATGTLPDGGNRSGNVELYETARFFTMTGDHVAGTPQTIESRERALAAVHADHIRDGPVPASDEDARETSTGSPTLDDAALRQRASSATNGEKFDRLYSGSTVGYDSQSEADMALCSLLAFWTGKDATQIDRLFRDSGLMRPKWDEVHYADGSTYGEKTIERAIDGTSDVYAPGRHADTATSTQTATTATADHGEVADRSSTSTAESDRLAAMETTIEHLEQEIGELREELAAVEAIVEQERRNRRTLERRLDATGRDRSTETGSAQGWRHLLPFG